MTHPIATAELIAELAHAGATYRLRRAEAADLPFLARVQYEASLPPHNQSFWDYPLYGLGVETLPFIETVMRIGANQWGDADSFIVLEGEAGPLGAAAGIEPTPDFVRGPVRLDRIDAVGAALGWTPEQTAIFCERYVAGWPDPEGNWVLLPQASWIIESVAIMPEARGHGLARPLMEALLDEGRRRGHRTVGITVANGNVAAQRLYERLGFRLYLTFGPAFFGEDDSFGGYTKYKRALD